MQMEKQKVPAKRLTRRRIIDVLFENGQISAKVYQDAKTLDEALNSPGNDPELLAQGDANIVIEL